LECGQKPASFHLTIQNIVAPVTFHTKVSKLHGFRLTD
jgi:hypothetical protein